jgi:3-methyl-2-oxobutanoate hydroxymethyltransferase
LECVPEKLAKIITEKISVPTIGIGAGKYCDGQVLVYQDMIAMFSGFTPKFAKKYADIGQLMKNAFAEYSKEVKNGIFPSDEHTFSISDEVLKKLK